MTIRVIGPRDPPDPNAINTTSRSKTWSRGLSPFFLGPVPLYPGAPLKEAKNMENLWQFSKVYLSQVDSDQNPTQEYWSWATRGWGSPRAERYPMGKGSVPLYSLWEGRQLPYLEARKTIYSPSYAKAVVGTEAFDRLLNLYKTTGRVTLWDFDGYDHTALGMSLRDVLNCPTRKMGHAFVLAYLLEKSL